MLYDTSMSEIRIKQNYFKKNRKQLTLIGSHPDIYNMCKVKYNSRKGDQQIPIFSIYENNV